MIQMEHYIAVDNAFRNILVNIYSIIVTSISIQSHIAYVKLVGRNRPIGVLITAVYIILRHAAARFGFNVSLYLLCY